MLLYFDEFKSNYYNTLTYYNKLPEYLHEMSAKDIVSHINRYGESARSRQQSAILFYLRWLNANYDVDTKNLFYELKRVLSHYNPKTSFNGFFSLTEMIQAIHEAEFTIESTGGISSNWCPLYAIFYLEWYGVTPDVAITIPLTDVSDDGKIVHIAAQKRTIVVDDSRVATFFSEYKRAIGYRSNNSTKVKPYIQNTFIRNSNPKGINITIKSIYNLRDIFVRGSGDTRFSKSNVYYSGRFNELYQIELDINELLTTEHKDIFERVFNHPLEYTSFYNKLTAYQAYKNALLNK